jgi:hypothetical protein
MNIVESLDALKKKRSFVAGYTGFSPAFTGYTGYGLILSMFLILIYLYYYL